MGLRVQRQSDCAQIGPRPLFRHQKIRGCAQFAAQTRHFGELHSAEIKDFALCLDRRGFSRVGLVLRAFGELPGLSGSRHPSAIAKQLRRRGRGGSHIAVLLLAACLGGCGGYAAFDPESTSAVSFSGGSSAAPNSGSAAGSSERKEAATLNTLFAGAAQGESDDRAAITPPV